MCTQRIIMYDVLGYAKFFFSIFVVGEKKKRKKITISYTTQCNSLWITSLISDICKWIFNDDQTTLF